jgi:hypothetical protein
LGDPVIAALIAGSAGLTGAILGGCLSWLGAYVVDRRRWRREDSRRYESERRHAYCRFLGCVSRLTNKDDPIAGKPLSSKDDLVTEWLVALAEVELVASEEVREAAQLFAMIVSDVLFGPPSTLPVSAWGDARKRFVAAVRKELGIPKVSVDKHSRPDQTLT